MTDRAEPGRVTSTDQLEAEQRGQPIPFDRAEPGVTPLTAAGRRLYDEQRIHNQAQRVRADDRHDERWLSATLAIEQEARTLDAATPRPGLVEALTPVLPGVLRRFGVHVTENSWPIIARDIAAALASGTGEPGPDVERLARSLRALEARDELTVADGFLGGRDDGDYVTFATSIAAAYANDKGADPTPEPK